MMASISTDHVNSAFWTVIVEADVMLLLFHKLKQVRLYFFQNWNQNNTSA